MIAGGEAPSGLIFHWYATRCLLGVRHYELQAALCSRLLLLGRAQALGCNRGPILRPTDEPPRPPAPVLLVPGRLS